MVDIEKSMEKRERLLINIQTWFSRTKRTPPPPKDHPHTHIQQIFYGPYKNFYNRYTVGVIHIFSCEYYHLKRSFLLI